MSNFYAGPSHIGGGFTIYSGSRRQRGGNLLGTLGRLIIPTGKVLAKRVGQKAAEIAAASALGSTISAIKRRFTRKKTKAAPTRKRKLKQKKATGAPPNKRRRVTPSRATLNRSQLF